MDYHSSHHSMYVRRPIAARERIPASRWVREWVPQEIAATGKRIFLLKWVREDMLKVLKDKFKESEPEEPKPEPTTEILFLCSYEGCNKAFPNEGAYRKHAHVHGERQYACSFPGCGKKFLDSSKLKRHQVVHTGEKNFICPHEGCGKAFNLDFNLKAHMKTHSQEHYHVCPYQDCDKRYTQECKLKSHIKAHHEKILVSIILCDLRWSRSEGAVLSEHDDGNDETNAPSTKAPQYLEDPSYNLCFPFFRPPSRVSL